VARLPFGLAGLGIVTAGEGEQGAPRRPQPARPPAQPKPPTNAAQSARERIAARMDREDVAVSPRTFNNTPSATAAAKLPLNLKMTPQPQPVHSASAPTGPAPSAAIPPPPPSGGQVQTPGAQTTAPPAAGGQQPQQPPATQYKNNLNLTPQEYQGVTNTQNSGFVPYSNVPTVTGASQPLNITASSQSEGSVAVPAPRKGNGWKLAAGGLGVGALLFMLFRGKRR
jgi:hypothetical protein